MKITEESKKNNIFANIGDYAFRISQTAASEHKQPSKINRILNILQEKS